MNDLNLNFIEKTTGTIFKGKRIVTGLYTIQDPVTFETRKITACELRKKFRSSKKNKFIAPTLKYSRPRISTKKMDEYLNEKYEVLMKENAS